MRVLKYGSLGPSVQLMQLALTRAGYGPLVLDGIFGSATRAALASFQKSKALLPDGIAGPLTHRRLLPWYTGYLSRIVFAGESFSSIASEYGVEVDTIITANPRVNPLNLSPGQTIIVPLPFSVVPDNIDYCAELIKYCVLGLAARYPFLTVSDIGRSVMGRPLWAISFGQGQNRVLYNASHHANEWICTPLLLRFVEELASAAASGGRIYNIDGSEILDYTSLFVVPALNPDGIDLVTGELQYGVYFSSALDISRLYPQFPFPSAWKANISGVDLNLQYPAAWDTAREIKFSQGITSPAPADFVGFAPLTAPESRALYSYTIAIDPDLTLSYHTQGNVIYWRYQDYEPVGSRSIADTLSEVSGYAVEETPYSSGFAGYKDWFIQDYNRPGYTIEAGLGTNPLPLSQFQDIYNRNLGILVLSALLT